jgi:hypothetical protein
LRKTGHHSSIFVLRVCVREEVYCSGPTTHDEIKKKRFVCLSFLWLLKKICQASSVFQVLEVSVKCWDILNLTLSNSEWSVKLCKELWQYGNKFMRYIHLNICNYFPFILFIIYAREIYLTPHQEKAYFWASTSKISLWMFWREIITICKNYI